MADVSIREAPTAPEFVRFREGFGQKFLLTVDTEEEFNWRAPLDRYEHRIDAVPALRKFQQFCEGFGVSPVYLIDYPIAASLGAAEALRRALETGHAEIGVQLHPWVNPPHDEEINIYNSYAGNLPAGLERAKFMQLRDMIERNFGTAPRSFRCGRYGAGANTAQILIDGGISIDTSVRATFDYSGDGGPNYRDHPVRPYWLNRAARLMELPLTTVFWGPLSRFGSWLYPRMWRIPMLRGALARTGLLDRIPLTPEGVSASEAIRGIDAAVDQGLPVLVLSFHSPSLVPGNTPYVASDAQLDEFYDWWRAVFAHLARRGIAPTSIAEINSAAELA